MCGCAYGDEMVLPEDQEIAMTVITESALRILIPRRNLRGSLREVTRQLIHTSIAQLRMDTARR